MFEKRHILGCTVAVLAYASCATCAQSQVNVTPSSENSPADLQIDKMTSISAGATGNLSIDSATLPPVSSPSGKSVLHDVASTTKWLHNNGLEFHAALKAEASSNFHSGFSRGGTDYRSLLETDLSVDMQKAVGWPGAQVQASFHDYFGSDATDELTGDVQGFSNIDSYPLNRIYELWFQQTLAERKLRVKLGRIDANTEFAYVENAADFLNSSMGYSPTILDMHSYPNPRLGAMIGFAPEKFLSASLAVFRCMPSGSMMLSEVGTRWRISRRVSVGRLATGFWIHPHTLSGFGGQTASGVHGYYAVLEQTLWKRANEIDDDSRGVRAFAQWGDANPWFNGIAHHFGVGGEWTGAFPRRSLDVVGVGVTTGWLGQDCDRDVNAGRERSIETFYKLPVRAWLSLTPDLQRIINPSGSLVRPREWAGSLRMAISF
jgi:porin